MIFKHHGVCFISISFWSRQFLVGIEGNLNLGVCDKIGLFLSSAQCISLMSSRNSEEEGEKWPPGDIGIIRALAAEPTHMGDLSCPKKGMSTTFYGTYVDNRLSHPRLWFDTQFSSPKKLLYIWVFPIPIYSTHHNVWKFLKRSHLNVSILAFSIIFCPITSELSGNTLFLRNLSKEFFEGRKWPY